MITQLSIQGLAIIDSVQIDFAPGFNVITGETGAGKSILIRALGLLTGGKACADVIRSGREFAVVTGGFHVPGQHRVVDRLRELGIPLDASLEVALLLRRQIHSKGRSQAWINDVPVALPSLRLIGGMLLDVFTQHENQRLLNAADHIGYVDSFVGDVALRETVRALGKTCSSTVQRLQQFLEELKDSGRQSDYLTFRYSELQRFEPTQQDYEAVCSYCEQAETFRKTRDPVVQALRILEENDEGVRPSQAAREASKLLGCVIGGSLTALQERAAACAADLDDIGFELGKRLSAMEFDEERLEQCQERLFGYQELFRKHSVPGIERLLEQMRGIENQLSGLETAGIRLEEELDGLLKSAKQLKQASQKLSVARLQAAQSIKDEVEKELAELHMPGSVFQVEFASLQRQMPALRWEGFENSLAAKWEKTKALLEGVSEHGAEKAQFLLSANPGEPPMALERVASGGELSRIMLALKKTLAADAETCVLVFDEIDTGISGRVADVVGRKMKGLAGRFQVLCISHLPQVAVYADSHFLVTKKGKAERTQSSIVPLSKEESAREIARLLSGREVSASSLAHAKNLIAQVSSQVSVSFQA